MTNQQQSRKRHQTDEFKQKILEAAEQEFGPDTRRQLKQWREDTHAGDYTQPINKFLENSQAGIDSYTDQELIKIAFHELKKHVENYDLTHEIEPHSNQMAAETLPIEPKHPE